MKKLLLLIMFFIAGCSSQTITKEDEPLIIAHRGASIYAPENTLPAYAEAVELGVSYIEIDLRMTKDGELVSIHDQDVDRTTNGSGKVIDFSLNELKQLDAGSWFDPKYVGTEIVTLEEIFQKFDQNTKYYIETRRVNGDLLMEEPLLKLIDDYDLVESVVIQSYSENSLKKIHELNYEIPLSQLIIYHDKEQITDKKVKEWKQYSSFIGLDASLVDENILKKFHDNDLKVHVFFWNSETEKSELARVIDLGVDGVFTNYIEYTQDLINTPN